MCQWFALVDDSYVESSAQKAHAAMEQQQHVKWSVLDLSDQYILYPVAADTQGPLKRDGLQNGGQSWQMYCKGIWR